MAVKEIMRMKKNVTSVTLTTLTMSLTTVKLELSHHYKSCFNIIKLEFNTNSSVKTSNWIWIILNNRFSSIQ